MGMKVIIDINEEKKDFILNFLENNNLDFEFEYDFDIPESQIEDMRKRREEALSKPSSLLTLDELKTNLEKK